MYTLPTSGGAKRWWIMKIIININGSGGWWCTSTKILCTIPRSMTFDVINVHKILVRCKCTQNFVYKMYWIYNKIENNDYVKAFTDVSPQKTCQVQISNCLTQTQDLTLNTFILISNSQQYRLSGEGYRSSNSNEKEDRDPMLGSLGMWI